MAPGIVDSGSTLVYQTGTRLKRMNVDENTSQKIVRNVDSLIHILKTAPNPDLAKEKMEAFLLQKENEEDQDYIEASRRLGDPHKFIEGLLDPKFIYCLHNSGLESLKKTKIPVIILYGDEDKTVNVKSNLVLIDKFLDSTQYEVNYLRALSIFL